MEFDNVSPPNEFNLNYVDQRKNGRTKKGRNRSAASRKKEESIERLKKDPFDVIADPNDASISLLKLTLGLRHISFKNWENKPIYVQMIIDSNRDLIRAQKENNTFLGDYSTSSIVDHPLEQVQPI